MHNQGTLMLIHNWWPVLKRSAALWCVYVTLLLQIGGSVCLYSFGRLSGFPPRLCRHHHWCQRVEVGLIRCLPVKG